MDRLTAEIQAAADRVAAAEQAAVCEAAELAAAYRAYQAGLTELQVDDPDELIELVTEWAATGDGENPARRVIDDAARSAVDALGRQDARLSARRDAFTTTAAELTAEIGRLEAGGHDAPPVPHTRDPQVRDTRPGAPLWKVTDFAPDVPEASRARLEAALESAGILDAWLTPDGDLISGDVVLVSGRRPVTGPSCDTVLVPAVNTGDPQAAALPETAVRAALSAIGLGKGTGTTWVTTDGRWANGVLAGTWHKEAAGYIGEGARETARRDRIARLTVELAEVNGAIAALDDALGELDSRKDNLTAEHRAVPSDAAVREAHTRVAERRRRRQELRDSYAEADRVRAARQEALEAARVAANEFAADTRLPADPAELAAVRTGLGDYRVALAALWPAAEAFEAAAPACGRGRRGARRGTGTADRGRRAGSGGAGDGDRRSGAVRGAAGDRRGSSRGAEPETGRAPRGYRTPQRRREGARELEQQAIGDRGKAEGARETLRTEIEEATRMRDAAVAEFQSFAATGVLRVALPDLEVPDVTQPWAATPAVILARTVNAGAGGY